VIPRSSAAFLRRPALFKASAFSGPFDRKFQQYWACDMIHTALSLTEGYSEREYLVQLVPLKRCTMNFLEQAAKAERLAKSVMDSFAFEALIAYARECRQIANQQSSAVGAIDQTPASEWASACTRLTETALHRETLPRHARSGQ
jgi:hypothetical protein